MNFSQCTDALEPKVSNWHASQPQESVSESVCWGRGENLLAWDADVSRTKGAASAVKILQVEQRQEEEDEGLRGWERCQSDKSLRLFISTEAASSSVCVSVCLCSFESTGVGVMMRHAPFAARIALQAQ